MADWLRSPSQRWFTNNHWVKYAFEKTRKQSVQWNSFYGQKGLRFTTKGINKENPNYQYRGGETCGICDLINNQSGCPGSAGRILCQYINTINCEGECTDRVCWCAFGTDGCWDGDAEGVEEIPCGDGRNPEFPCNTPCFTPDETECAPACAQEVDCDGCTGEPNLCLGKYGNIVECDSDDALCDPCTGECDDMVACPCGDQGNSFSDCVIQPPGDMCPSLCCLPGEEGCVECCAEDDPNCGNWIPEDLCGGGGGCCNPGGTPYSCDFCNGCEICNIYPDLPQCQSGQCCRCDGTGPWVDCDDIVCGDPGTCPDFTSNCYACGDKVIPIWFECEEVDPCPNPFNPDCSIGDEIVCYEYNTNDPIYYNASNTGATVIKEYDNPVAGGTYGYGNVATICDIPDEFQLCVYGVTSGNVATKLTYQDTLSGTGATWTLDTNDNVILNGSGSYNGYTKLRIARCTDDSKMFLTFTDGAKLSADDLNKTMHQLLFLIQEKEFASNSYVQLQNAIGLGGNISWKFASTTLTDYDTYTFTLVSYDPAGNTTKTYQFDDAGVIATGAIINTDKVCIQINGKTTAAQIAEQAELAIKSANGHGTKFTTKLFSTTTGNDSLSVTQKIVGTNGNLAVAHSSELDNDMVTPLWQFVNGAEYDTSNPMITFDPPLELPVNFDLSNTSISDVLAWDGNGSFNTQTPAQLGAQIQVDNLNGVVLTSTSTDDFLYFDGNNWVNKDFSTEVSNVISVRDFDAIESYDVASNSTLDDYFYATCDANLKTLWAAAGDCVTNLTYQMIPNAITSFGLGYYAAERQIHTQVNTLNSTLDTFVKETVATSLDGGGTITSSLRWEIGRGEGRSITGVAGYPQAYFDVLDFDVLDHPTAAGNGGVGDAGVIDGTGSNAPDLSLTDVAYYRNWPNGTCVSCRNKVYANQIDKFKYSGNKSTSFGLFSNSVSGSTSNSTPVEDRYLKRIRSAITKSNWGTELGYGADRHPLKNYPNNSLAVGATGYPASYTDYADSDNLIFGTYLYNTTDTTTATVWNSTKNLPTVVTYYLSQLWGGGSSGIPSFIQWDGSIDAFGNIDMMTDNGNSYTGGTSVPVYLDTATNRHYYWRWLIMGQNTGGAGSTTTPSVYDTLSNFSPFDAAKLNLDDTHSVLPANSSSGESTDQANENDLMAKAGAYSIKFDANKVFSNMERVLPDMYDEYVFEVQLDAEARASATSICPDGLCYEVQAKIEKYIDGCAEVGDTDCSQVGSGGTNTGNAGYHLYPTDFEADVLGAWDTYPYDKLRIEIRNKTAVGFDLVVHAPRLKRIGLIDIYKDGVDSNSDGSDNQFTYRQLALDFLSDYTAGDWDATGNNSNPGNTTDTKNSTPVLRDRTVESPAAFSVETALQFVRLGLPANIRIAFQTITTPQKNLFAG